MILRPALPCILALLFLGVAPCLAEPLVPPAFTAGPADVYWTDTDSLAAAADHGAPNACLELGERLMIGNSLAQDRARGLALYEKAVAGGSVEAAQRLARVHLASTPPDHRSAFAAFQAGAFLGEPALAYNIGLLLLNGRGVEADPVESLAWLIVAANQGANGGALDQARALLAHDDTQIARAEARADELDRLITARKAQRFTPAALGQPRPNGTWRNVAELQAAAAQGAPNACAELAGLHLNGLGVPNDIPRAIALYDQAIHHGNLDAAVRLAGALENGELGLRTDLRLAFHYYKIAAYGGDRTAQENLGTLFVSGRGTPRDYVEGLAWLKLAANDGKGDGEALNATRQRLADQPGLLQRAERRAHALQAEISRRQPPKSDEAKPNG